MTSTTFKSRQPSLYTGETQFSEWVVSFLNYVKANAVPDTDIVRLLGSYLTGISLKLYAVLTSRNPSITWEVLKNEFSQAFDTHDILQNALITMTSRTFKPQTETLGEYYVDKIKLMEGLTIKFNDEERLAHLIAGLDHQSQILLSLRSDLSVSTFLSAARAVTQCQSQGTNLVSADSLLRPETCASSEIKKIVESAVGDYIRGREFDSQSAGYSPMAQGLLDIAGGAQYPAMSCGNRPINPVLSRAEFCGDHYLRDMHTVNAVSTGNSIKPKCSGLVNPGTAGGKSLGSHDYHIGNRPNSYNAACSTGFCNHNEHVNARPSYVTTVGGAQSNIGTSVDPGHNVENTPSSVNSKPPCIFCNKTNHVTYECFYNPRNFRYMRGTPYYRGYGQRIFRGRGYHGQFPTSNVLYNFDSNPGFYNSQGSGMNVTDSNSMFQTYDSCDLQNQYYQHPSGTDYSHVTYSDHMMQTNEGNVLTNPNNPTNISRGRGIYGNRRPFPYRGQYSHPRGYSHTLNGFRS